MTHIHQQTFQWELRDLDEIGNVKRLVPSDHASIEFARAAQSVGPTDSFCLIDVSANMFSPATRMQIGNELDAGMQEYEYVLARS